MGIPEARHKLIESMIALIGATDNSNADRRGMEAIAEFKQFLEEIPGGFLIYRANGNEEILYANKALIETFGCDSYEDFLKHTDGSFRGIVHPDDLDEVEKSIVVQIAESQKDLDYVEYRIIRKDGSVRWLEDYGHFVHYESEDIFYVFLTDATEKRLALQNEKETLINQKKEKEQKIKTLIKEYDEERKIVNQEQLRRLEVIEGLSVNYECILYADLDTDNVLPYRLNDEMKERFGENNSYRNYSKLIYEFIDTWVHSEDSGQIRKITSPEYIRTALASSKTYYSNFKSLSDGEIRFMQIRIVNVGGSDVSQVVIGLRNVDEEIKHEMEQMQVLEEALRTAKRAETAKNTFLSNMSHDMRTPLNAIFGFAALAKEHADDKEAVKRYIDKIETAGKQIFDLVDKVLEITDIESGEIHISETPCNICDLVQEIYSLKLPRAKNQKIAFSQNCANVEHYDVFADADNLKRVLTHLAENAIKYTKKNGKVEIAVQETELLPNGYAVYKFTVKDTGIGISAEALDRIFEPFEREKNTTSSGIFGSGLGLTIAKNIIELMGGEIKAESTIGKGSVFTVTLRLRLQKKNVKNPDTKAILEEIMHSKILVVEDNELNLEIETDILEGIGFTVDAAENGKIAVEKIKAAAPDEYSVVLMDIQMPVMDGRQASSAIRRLEERSNVPIIALSANAFESDKRLSIAAGMDAHLTKPIDVPILLDTIAEIIFSRKKRNI